MAMAKLIDCRSYYQTIDTFGSSLKKSFIHDEDKTFTIFSQYQNSFAWHLELWKNEFVTLQKLTYNFTAAIIAKILYTV